jgi:hypothetical protein
MPLTDLSRPTNRCICSNSVLEIFKLGSAATAVIGNNNPQIRSNVGGTCCGFGKQVPIRVCVTGLELTQYIEKRSVARIALIGQVV